MCFKQRSPKFYTYVFLNFAYKKVFSLVRESKLQNRDKMTKLVTELIREICNRVTKFNEVIENEVTLTS